MSIYQQNAFLFSPKYRVWRHAAFWAAHILFFSLLWLSTTRIHFWQNLLTVASWIPVRMLYCYSLTHWAIPKFLLKQKHREFVYIIALWVIAGWFVNYLARVYYFIPLQDALELKTINRDPWSANSYLASLIISAAGCVIVLFRYWMQKQQEFMQAEKEKIIAELQLLKAQVHPHFLFNTLNNIYSFSLQASPKTPAMVLKLSSLLGYMLYDCKADEVLLEKEIDVMKAYIELEKERYANRIDISLNIEGDIKDQFIAPLLLLPFLENAFKHGTSEQLEKPWLSMDLVVQGHTLRCKIANSKNEVVPVSPGGIGINNVKKRLAFLYAGKHELKLADEGAFFVVSLVIELVNYKSAAVVMQQAPALSIQMT